MRENSCDFVEIDGDLDQKLEEEIGKHIGELMIGELMNVIMRVQMLCEWKQLGAVRFDGK